MQNTTCGSMALDLWTKQDSHYNHPSTPYRVSNGCIYHDCLDSAGKPVAKLLSNFTVKIVRELIVNDEFGIDTYFEVSGRLSSGCFLPTVSLAASELQSMNWVLKRWGSDAIIYPVHGAKAHLFTAIQLFNQNAKKCMVFRHIGWHLHHGDYYYLHAGGAIGSEGSVNDVEVQLDGVMANYELAYPSAGDELLSCVRASIGMINLAPDSVTVPLFASIYGAAIDRLPFSLHLTGETGQGKSVLSALFLSHYGATFTADQLPASWNDTANSLLEKLFLVNSAPLVIDEAVPGGGYGPQDLQRSMDRVMRAQANGRGRDRLNASAGIRSPKVPRGTLISTGEDIPQGQSLQARVLMLDLKKDALRWSQVSEAQALARNGIYSRSLAAYICWLAPQLDHVREELGRRVDALRQRYGSIHKRTGNSAAHLMAGGEVFFRFATEVGAIDSGMASCLTKRFDEALLSVVRNQLEHLSDANPVHRFLELLRDLLSMRKVHLENADGGQPENPEMYGWEREKFPAARHEWKPGGVCIGWVDSAKPAFVFLDPTIVFSQVSQLAKTRGEALSMNPGTLWKRMLGAKVISKGQKDRNLGIIYIRGRKRSVLNLHAHLLAETGIFGISGMDDEEQAI